MINILSKSSFRVKKKAVGKFMWNAERYVKELLYPIPNNVRLKKRSIQSQNIGKKISFSQFYTVGDPLQNLHLHFFILIVEIKCILRC